MFVKHALEDTNMPGRSQTPTKRPERTGLGLGDLRIFQDCGDEGEIGSEDSDDEDEGSLNIVPDEITVTTLNLLLALLEGNFLLSSVRSPVLIGNHSKRRAVSSHVPCVE